MKIYTAVFSQIVPVKFPGLVQAAEQLRGQELAAGRSRLQIHGRVGDGIAGAVRFAGSLRTGSPLIPAVKVELVVSPWSSDRSEVAIHPMTSLGQLDSLRARRFFNAARSILPVVVDRLYTELPEAAPVELVLAA
jgi:hypothetical protein